MILVGAIKKNGLVITRFQDIISLRLRNYRIVQQLTRSASSRSCRKKRSDFFLATGSLAS